MLGNRKGRAPFEVQRAEPRNRRRKRAEEATEDVVLRNEAKDPREVAILSQRNSAIPGRGACVGPAPCATWIRLGHLRELYTHLAQKRLQSMRDPFGLAGAAGRLERQHRVWSGSANVLRYQINPFADCASDHEVVVNSGLREPKEPAYRGNKVNPAQRVKPKTILFDAESLEVVIRKSRVPNQPCGTGCNAFLAGQPIEFGTYQA